MQLISEAYRAEQAALHATGTYGWVARRFGPLVGRLAGNLGARSLLDYGCGSQRSLLGKLELQPGVAYEGYDPAVADYARAPAPADLVCCIDVLEHVEPELLADVLDHLGSLCNPYGFFTIHTGPATKTLADGRNTHLIQQPLEWWRPLLEQRFEILLCHQFDPQGFCVLALARSAAGRSVSPAACAGILASLPRDT